VLRSKGPHHNLPCEDDMLRRTTKVPTGWGRSARETDSRSNSNPATTHGSLIVHTLAMRRSMSSIERNCRCIWHAAYRKAIRPCHD
jgi:hypothetical protein